MKISKTKLRQIIREEVRALNEMPELVFLDHDDQVMVSKPFKGLKPGKLYRNVRPFDAGKSILVHNGVGSSFFVPLKIISHVKRDEDRRPVEVEDVGGQLAKK